MTDIVYQSTPITETYARLTAVNLGRPHVTEGRLAQGTVTVRVAGLDGFSDDGSLQRSGVLTGLRKLYRTLNLGPSPDKKLSFRILSSNDVLIVTDTQTTVVAQNTLTAPPPASQCIFSHNKLRPVHIERFRPENLLNWTPTAEVDVYMAFGVLEPLTGYRYCCGVNTALLAKLGYSVDPKPDAILIDDETEEYRVAEFEVYSSSFAKHGHKADQVDVLLAWIDDEQDRTKLPSKVVSLQEVARVRAIELLSGDDSDV